MRHSWFVCVVFAMVLVQVSDLKGQLPLRDSFPVQDIRGGLGVGDLNADGFDDVAFISSNGEVQIVSGVDGTLFFFRPSAFSTGGVDIAGGGDVTGDGIDDFILGYPLASSPAAPSPNWAGKIEVYSGATMTLAGTAYGAPGDGVGGKVAIVGDTNGDGFAEFVGQSEAPFSGSFFGPLSQVSVFDGDSLSMLGILTIPSGMVRDVFAGGDMTGDGIPDILVHSELHFAAATATVDQLRLRVYSGANLQFIRQRAILTTEITGHPTLAFGVVAVVDDMNGDGVKDVIIGQSLFLNGQVQVLSGLDFSLIHFVAGDPNANGFGIAVGEAGDVNGDGTPDFIASSFFQDGAFAVFSGVDAAPLTLISGASPVSVGGTGEVLGRHVGLCGDLNGDGFPELFVSALGPNPDQMKIYSFAGEFLYGDSGNAIQSLSLSWRGGVVDPASGVLSCTGALPGASGAIGVSLNFADTVFGVFPLFIDPSPNVLNSVTNFGFDLNGELQVSVNIRSPFVGGTSFYLQVFSPGPVFAASNGMQLLFTK